MSKAAVNLGRWDYLICLSALEVVVWYNFMKAAGKLISHIRADLGELPRE